MSALQESDFNEMRSLICSLQKDIRDHVWSMLHKTNIDDLNSVNSVTSADTIYSIDKYTEEPIIEWFEKHWPQKWPIEIVMEGIEESDPLCFPKNVPPSNTILKCIIDPIDGTRNIMYDKRSAWILAGIAPQKGPTTCLTDIHLSVMTEIPTSRQWRSDQVSAVRGGGKKGIVADSTNLFTKETKPLALRPSQAKDFKHGFASLSRFFPEGKELMSRIEEALWTELYGEQKESPSPIFDDQYICSGGQIYEILNGHDRMHGDLRPLAFEKLGIQSGLVCHPYDVCTGLILTEAGGVFESPEGGPVKAPMNTVAPVSWMGYANQELARMVRPVMKELLQKHLA